MRGIAGIAVFAFVCGIGQAQEAATKFAIADVHAVAQGPNQFVRVAPPRNGRYEVRTATMVDLIRTAYGFDADKILGGPSWLEMNRYDVVAKLPSEGAKETDPEVLKVMLQSLLAERFKLVTHQETKSLSSYVLTAGKKPSLKEADGAGDTGCRIHTSSAAPVEGGVRLMMNGSPISLGPGMMLMYECRNMTMEAFAAGLRGMLGVSVGTNPVLDETGLKGKWNFDVKWSLQINGGPADGGERIAAADAIEKQLGLKLEQRPIPLPVIVVDSVLELPTANPPGVAEALPEIKVPTEFDVADVKPSSPDSNNQSMRSQPGGKFTTEGTPLRSLLLQAFNTTFGFMNADVLAGIPKFADTSRFDVTAKAADTVGTFNLTTVGPMLRTLLEQRFGLKYHVEERQVSAYSLVAVKPKLKKADPASRTHCIRSNAPQGSPQGTQILTCQNVTMGQFTDQLRNMGTGSAWPVLDATNLEGTWDFTLQWGVRVGGGGRGGDAGAANGDAATASDPSAGLTLFEAVDRELGLKLELQKRMMPVTVIDHLEEKPSDN